MPGYRQRPTAETVAGLPEHLKPKKKAAPRRQVIVDTTARVPRTAARPRVAQVQPGGKLTNTPNAPFSRAGDVPFKVEAIAIGYYDHVRRRPNTQPDGSGDVFTIAGKSWFSSRWMRRVDPETPEHVTGAAEALKQRHIELKTGGPGVVRATGDESVLE